MKPTANPRTVHIHPHLARLMVCLTLMFWVLSSAAAAQDAESVKPNQPVRDYAISFNAKIGSDMAVRLSEGILVDVFWSRDSDVGRVTRQVAHALPVAGYELQDPVGTDELLSVSVTLTTRDPQTVALLTQAHYSGVMYLTISSTAPDKN